MKKELKDLDDLLDDDDYDELKEVENSNKESNVPVESIAKLEIKDTADERLILLKEQMNKVFFKNHENKIEEPKIDNHGNNNLDDIFKDLNLNDVDVDTDNIESMLSSFINKMLHKDVLYPTLQEMLSSGMDSGKPLANEKKEIIELICEVYEQEDYSDSNPEQMEKISVLVDKLESMDTDFQSKVENEDGSFNPEDLEQLTKNMNPDDCKMQ
ncbi:hypothetical protein QEN19_002507 [Hanseniaspora menglaensis]